MVRARKTTTFPTNWQQRFGLARLQRSPQTHSKSSGSQDYNAPGKLQARKTTTFTTKGTAMARAQKTTTFSTNEQQWVGLARLQRPQTNTYGSGSLDYTVLFSAN
jgi:hypothetical protein